MGETATAVKDSGDLAQAAEGFERSIRIREQLLERQIHNVTLQRNLLVAYGNYATLLGIPWAANLGRFAEARMYGEKSVALCRQLVKADPQDKTARYDPAMSLARLGMVD